ncbi:brain-enriched guanylate kinase-associated protein-like isoform X1 [Acipenser ruthenus]|uniref:brain-enriched guanylate kinase-associated protein-like isoform X1 n=1 Tax=Acipenser ruthenus TaxID=7906 RepID=UPI00145B5D15|nr:brain-enriched guanylate kinase-associated protein-like isoform X1 [Acipenser ruthenus]XP_058844113.1 brain-enriched guanylate kinase-associated protein-like isoform X1 [Acipenser ruthenus]
MKKLNIGKMALKNSRKHHKKSSLQEQKEDLRKRLSYTTHKLELLESECDATRQYLETELRRAQEELEKLTEKLHRIQNSYSTLQRINQDLEEQIHRTSQRDDDDKRALSHEIIVLNNHLMEAKITIDKLREDNDLYRKDCNVAAQLLQCSKSHFRSHKLSELPSEFQERVSTHMEKHGCGISLPLYNSPYSDSVPISVIAKLLEKPAPNSMPGSHTSSPQSREGNFAHNNMGSAEKLNRRSAYKSDLYCSDTALYCPDERMRERRQSVDLHVRDPERFRPQNSTDSTTEEDGFQSSFSHEPFNEFTPSLPASSSYSSFSAQSDEKGHGASSTLSSPHQALYMDWRDENYDRKSSSSYEKDSPGFPKSRSFQHMAQGHQNDSSPVYTRTVPTCFTEPFHSPSAASPHPLYADSRSPVHIPEEDLSGRWRQLSVEDVNAYSYRNPGRVSPYSFSEQHFAIRPAKSKLGHLYSSFQEGEDVYQSRIMDPACFMPTSPNLERETGLRSQEKMQMYRQKEDDQKSERSLFHGSSKDKGSTNSVKKEYVDVSPNSSAESLNQSSLEALDLQHYTMEHEPPSALRQKPPHYQRFGTTGLCRKDSLTKAQLYGTLLN